RSGGDGGVTGAAWRGGGVTGAAWRVTAVQWRGGGLAGGGGVGVVVGVCRWWVVGWVLSWVCGRAGLACAAGGMRLTVG
ncbi:hypothetical protein ACWEBX_41410, partial [Streptomyces sp. NPDC005070]